MYPAARRNSWRRAPNLGEKDISVTEGIKSDVLLPFFTHEFELCLVTLIHSTIKENMVQNYTDLMSFFYLPSS